MVSTTVKDDNGVDHDNNDGDEDDDDDDERNFFLWKDILCVPFT